MRRFQGSGGTNATVIIAGTLTTDDNKNNGDTGSTSTWSGADVLLSGGTINLGTSSGDGQSHLIIDNASTLTVTGNATINGPDVTSTGYGVTTVGVDNQGTTVVTGTLSLNTVYAIDNNGGNGAFVNDGAVNVTGSGDVVVVSQQDDAITGTGTFFVTGGGNFDDTKDVGVVSSPIASANIVVGSGGSFDVSTGVKNTPTFTPNSLFETGSWSDVVVGGAGRNDTATYNALTDTITVDQTGLGAVIQNVTLDGVSSGALTVNVIGNNDYITTPCFAAGTRILTARGEVAVQDLREGDRAIVLLPTGEAEREVVWIGNRGVNVRAHPRPEQVAPVTVRAGALADGVPARDLVLSPDHALFVDGRFIQVRQLINDISVIQDLGCTSVHYFHVELSSHSVLYAEGTPAESYLDTGNRDAFANAGEATQLHPNFATNVEGRTRAMACAPLATDEATVRPVWQHLAGRAIARLRETAVLSATTNADLRLLAGKRKLRPSYVDGNRYVFAVPSGVDAVRLLSRAAAPAETKPWVDDRRPLGVAVRRITQRGANPPYVLVADHPDLCEGWYPAETSARGAFRWTNGNAHIPVRPDAQVIEVDLHATGTYPIDMVAAGRSPKCDVA